MHEFSEYSNNHPSGSRAWVPSKISLRSTAIVPIQLEIPLLLGDHLSLSLSLLLVLFDPFVLVDMIYELMHAPNRLLCQRFSQIMLGKQVDLKSPYGHVVEIPINLIEHLPVPIRICFQGFLLPHGHGQQGVRRLRNPTASDKTSPEHSSKLLKGVDKAFP